MNDTRKPINYAYQFINYGQRYLWLLAHTFAAVVKLWSAHQISDAMCSSLMNVAVDYYSGGVLVNGHLE